MAVGSKIDARDFATSHTLEVTRETPSIGSWSNASDAFSSVLISADMTPLINGWD